jgi:hypothetical protein
MKAAIGGTLGLPVGIYNALFGDMTKESIRFKDRTNSFGEKSTFLKRLTTPYD